MKNKIIIITYLYIYIYNIYLFNFFLKIYIFSILGFPFRKVQILSFVHQKQANVLAISC